MRWSTPLTLWERACSRKRQPNHYQWRGCTTITTHWSQTTPASSPQPLWERACPRRRQPSQHNPLNWTTTPCRSEPAREKPKASTCPAEHPAHRNQARPHNITPDAWNQKRSLRVAHYARTFSTESVDSCRWRVTAMGRGCVKTF